MKKSIILLASIASIAFGSCKKENIEDPESTAATTGTITIEVKNQIAGSPIELDARKYTNAAGNKYGVSELKYYLSNFILEKADGTADTIEHFQLVDIRKPEQCTFTLKDVPNGMYTKIRFYVGVGPDRNHTGAQDGFLDPQYGMIWTWNTGYTFFKMEGTFLNTNSENKPVRHHLGTDDALSEVELLLNTDVQGNERKIILYMDLNTVYNAAVMINFNSDADRQSLSSLDALWISAMRSNIPYAFTASAQ